MIEAEHLKHAGITHGFFTRGGGHSTGIFASLNCGLGSGDDIELVTRNRSIVARALNVAPENLVSAHQVHSADVVHVTQSWSIAERPKVDGMVTATKGIAIGVLTADCGPILFVDPEAGVIGAAHAGWKGALSGITQATVEAMVGLGALRDRTIAVIGPTISQMNYEVGPEFPDRFIAADADNAKFFIRSSQDRHFMFDLPGFLMKRMKQDGLRHVYNLGHCTYADEARFFSYRRATHRGQTDYGRLISAIALV
jgi:polyphenol oxidase